MKQFKSNPKVVPIVDRGKKSIPIGYTHNFDIDESLSECDPKERPMPKIVAKGSKFKERVIVPTKLLNRDQVRMITDVTGNVSLIQASFERWGYLHDQYPPVAYVDKNDNLQLIVGCNRHIAATNLKWKNMMVDIYEIPDELIRNQFAVTSNHHKTPASAMRKKDIINLVLRNIRDGLLSHDDQVIKDAVDIYALDKTSTVRKEIVRDITKHKAPDASVDMFQNYHLGDGGNSVAELAMGHNVLFPDLRLPFKGDAHYSLKAKPADVANGIKAIDENNGIRVALKTTTFVDKGKVKNIPGKDGVYGYALSESKGFKEGLINGLYMTVKHDGAEILYYGYISDPTKTNNLTTARFDLEEKFKEWCDKYARFVSISTGISIDQVKIPFRFVGFLPQYIKPQKGSLNTGGKRKETTIVNAKGQPVDSLTGELL